MSSDARSYAQLADYQRLVLAAAEALSLMQAMGWRSATATKGLDAGERREAVAAETVYANLRDALPIPARFAAELNLKDPLNVTRKTS